MEQMYFQSVFKGSMVDMKGKSTAAKNPVTTCCCSGDRDREGMVISQRMEQFRWDVLEEQFEEIGQQSAKKLKQCSLYWM